MPCSSDEIILAVINPPAEYLEVSYTSTYPLSHLPPHPNHDLQTLHHSNYPAIKYNHPDKLGKKPERVSYCNYTRVLYWLPGTKGFLQLARILAEFMNGDVCWTPIFFKKKVVVPYVHITWRPNLASTTLNGIKTAEYLKLHSICSFWIAHDLTYHVRARREIGLKTRLTGSFHIG